MRNGLCCAAEDALGRQTRKQPEWFTENEDILRPLLGAKSEAQAKYLQMGTASTKRSYRHCQRAVRDAVKEIKDSWVESVALEAERPGSHAGATWQCICRLQAFGKGRSTVRTAAVLDEGGDLVKDPDGVIGRWSRHFKNVLNVESAYNPDVIHGM